jgi:hypothetical protein
MARSTPTRTRPVKSLLPENTEGEGRFSIQCLTGRLTDELNALDTAIGILAEALEPVLFSQPPACGEEGRAAAHLPPALQRIQDQIDYAQVLRERVNDLARRVAVI